MTSDYGEIYRARGLGYRFGGLHALDDLSFAIRAGEILGVVGPNGAGKTTLLRILCGLLRGWSGDLAFRGRPIGAWDRRAFARRVAYLPQQAGIAFPYTAREVVLMGRLPHQNGGFFESDEDHRRVEEALRLTDCEKFSRRLYHDLSGGEQQLVGLASALAQDPTVLLLDEPTVFLDLRHQLQIYRILKDLHDARGLTLVVVTHDLDLAESFCSRLLVLKGGALAADIPAAGDSGPEITSDLIERVFGVRASESRSEGGRRRISVWYGR
jgi:ABC-type cobalamin/Fe3+-siderophores transport system ATPase subunit